MNGSEAAGNTALEITGLIARLQKATKKDVDDLSPDISRIAGTWELIDNRFPSYPLYAASIDSALTLLPKTATNLHLCSFGGHGRRDVKDDCWAFQIHDTAQLVGSDRAARHIKCLKLPFDVGQQPAILLEKAIAERFCEFGSSHAATAAIAICVTALKCRIGHTVDDDLWPMIARPTGGRR